MAGRDAGTSQTLHFRSEFGGPAADAYAGRRTGCRIQWRHHNFLELREELEKSGAVFGSRTDTEVLLHGYRQWGIAELVGRLRGMFAIGLWDNKTRLCYLIRDRLGVKPLLYSVENGALTFASTAGALRKGLHSAAVDPVAIAEFLEFGFITDQRSIYLNVKKVPPATILEWDGGRLSATPFWSAPRVQATSTITFSEAVESTESILRDAVKLRLQADVPVGALLSGGIDSTLVCWAASSLGADIRTFTIGTPKDSSDESADAVSTAQRLGIRHSVIDLSAQELPATGDLISAYGEPFACASALGMLRVSRAVRQDVTVLLTGDGGDDVFLGYPYHRNFFAAQRLAARLAPGLAGAWPQMRQILPPVGLARRARHFVDYATGGLGAVIQVHDGLPLYHAANLLGPRLDGVTVPQRGTSLSQQSARNLLEDFLLYDWRTTLTGEYMTKVDGATMYYALEARSPFLDHVLWDYAGTLPFELRLHNGELKSVLREIVRRRVGENIAGRVKRGFEIPVSRWLANEWGPQFLELFHESVLAEQGFLQSQPSIDLWKRTSPKGKVPVQLWRLFVLENWMRSASI